MGLGGKSRLITNFVDTLQFKKTTTLPVEHEETAVYVGRLEPLQTPELLVEAFKKVIVEAPQAKLHIVGYGTLSEQLKSLIHGYGLDGKVSLMGKQSDVRKFLWNSDIFIATNFGYIASLEAWSAGCAVIAPNFGILKETISDQYNGILFTPKSDDELASSLLALLKDKSLRQRIAVNGEETVKGYDIRAVAPKISDVYQSVI
jgi:glycosyltransferase involved in cell wall biosynthesis